MLKPFRNCGNWRTSCLSSLEISLIPWIGEKPTLFCHSKNTMYLFCVRICADMAKSIKDKGGDTVFLGEKVYRGRGWGRDNKANNPQINNCYFRDVQLSITTWIYRQYFDPLILFFFTHKWRNGGLFFFFLSFYFVLRGEVSYWIDTVLNKLDGKYQGKIRKEFETGESAR